MLGEKIGELNGKRTSLRVLPPNNNQICVEVCFAESGKLYGIDCQEVGTYVSKLQPDGTMYGEGQGVLTSNQGETATWTGTGVGTRSAGGTSYRGCIYFRTSSQKLAKLNGLCVVFEHDSDDQGNTRSRLSEWR